MKSMNEQTRRDFLRLAYKCVMSAAVLTALTILSSVMAKVEEPIAAPHG